MLNFKKIPTQGLFYGEIMRDLLIYMPKSHRNTLNGRKKISYKNENSARFC